MTCPFCGKADNPAHAKFCSHCGTALLTSTNTGAGHLGHFDERFGAPQHATQPSSPTPPEPLPAASHEMYGPWRTPNPAAAPASPGSIVAATGTQPIDPPGPPPTADLPSSSSTGDDDDTPQEDPVQPIATLGSPDPADPPVATTTFPSPSPESAATAPAPEPLALPAGEPPVTEPVAAATDANPGPEGSSKTNSGSEPPPGGCRWDGTIPPAWAASTPEAPRSAASRYWATGAHASAFVGAWMGGVPAFVGPLIVWLVRKDTDPFAAEHGRNALNFNLSVIVYVIGMIIFSIFTLGVGLLVTIPGFIILGLAWFALTLIGTIKAASSETYRYPLTIRFVR